MVKHLYLGTMSRRLNAFRSEKDLLFLRVLPHLSHRFLLVLYLAVAIRLEIICVSFSFFVVDYKAKNINPSWMFDCENLWVKIIGEDVKTLQVYYIEPDKTASDSLLLWGRWRC